MHWEQFAIMFISFVGLFIWNRTESRSDARHMDAKLESNRNLSIQIHKETQETINKFHKETQQTIYLIRKESQDILSCIREESRAFQLAMAQESKDFHGRLCSIEERSRK